MDTNLFDLSLVAEHDFNIFLIHLDHDLSNILIIVCSLSVICFSIILLISALISVINNGVWKSKDA